MGRIERKRWVVGNPFKIRGRGGITDAFDDAVKQVFRITDQEYNDLCDGTPEELDLLISQTPTFADKRNMIHMLNKYVDYSKDEVLGKQWTEPKTPTK